MDVQQILMSKISAVKQVGVYFVTLHVVYFTPIKLSSLSELTFSFSVISRKSRVNVTRCWHSLTADEEVEMRAWERDIKPSKARVRLTAHPLLLFPVLLQCSSHLSLFFLSHCHLTVSCTTVAFHQGVLWLNCFSYSQMLMRGVYGYVYTGSQNTFLTLMVNLKGCSQTKRGFWIKAD